MKRWFIFFVPLILAKFWNLGLVPVFYDEAIYLSEGAKIVKDIRNLFIAFEGVQFPIMTWALALVNFFTHSFLNLLISGRLLTVSLDVASAFLIYLIGKKIFSQNIGILATLVYLSLPLTFIHSRFVMLEPLTNLFSLAAIYSIITANPVGVASFSLLAFFTKPLAAETLGASYLWPLFASTSNFIKLYKKVLPAILVTGLIILAIFIPLAGNFSRHVNVVLNSPFTAISEFYFNFRRVLVWQRLYLTLPVLSLLVLSFIIGLFKKQWPVVWLGLWVAGVTFVASYFGKHLYPRHLYLLAAPASLLAASFFAKLSKKVSIIIISLILIFCWQINFRFLFNPVMALAGEDRQQFYQDWSSGVGLKEVAQKLDTISQQKSLDVYVEDDPLTSWALPDLFSTGKSNFKIISPGSSPVSGSYVVINRDPDLIKGWPVATVAAFIKSPSRSLTLYKAL